MYPQVEIGDDIPPRGWKAQRRVRPAKVARGLIIALIVGALAGLAIMLQVKGWGTLASESGGSCGSSSQGVSYGACPRGITPALIISFVVGLPAVPLAFVFLFRKGWFRRGFLAIGAVAGVLAGQSLFAIWHGTDLAIAWTAPHDSSSDLTTVGAWVNGGSLIRVRVDEVVSYAAATGQPQWTLPVPGTDVACSVSGTSSTSIALISYGQDSSTCDHVMAVDLGTGRQLWSAQVQNPYGGPQPTGLLAIAGGTGLILTDDGITGVSARSGTRQWSLAAPTGCTFQLLAASAGSAIAEAACESGFYVVSINPATGKAAWKYHVSEPSVSYQFQVLSVSPVVINDKLTGPRGTSTVRVFGPGGSVTSTFPVSGIPLHGGTVALNTASTDGFSPPVVVADGMLVGVTTVNGAGGALVGYQLASGQRQWLMTTPDQVNDVALKGDELAFVDESDPACSLEEVGLTTGKVTSLGFFTQGVYESGDSGLYVAGGDYLVVNQDGDSSGQPPVAAIKVPVPKG
ncbi:MAG TPA: PQQ-binding-like beta-propeller repeat protein [Trebonia sp.]